MDPNSSSSWISISFLIFLFLPATAIELPQKALAELENEEFRLRENAQRELLAWARLQPGLSMDEFLRQSRIAKDPEVRLRCMAILRELVMDQYMGEGQGFVGIRMANKIVDIPGKQDPCHVVHVISVNRDTPADQAGIRLNDMIISLNGLAWTEELASEMLADQIAAMKPGTKVKFQIYRDGKLIDCDVVLRRRPLNANVRFFEGQNYDPEAAERTAMDAYFRDWLSERKLRK